MAHSIHNAPINRATTDLTPEVKTRIIKMKLARFCSVEIRDRLNVTSSQIDKVWQAYRQAHAGTPAVGTGTHSQRRAAKGVA